MNQIKPFRRKIYPRQKPFWQVMFSKRGGLARYHCHASSPEEARNRTICAMGETYLVIHTIERI